MYNYQDFKHKFGDKSAESKMIELYSLMMGDCNYKSHELLNYVGGNAWETLACIDRLVELKLIRCVDNTHSSRDYWMYRKI